MPERQTLLVLGAGPDQVRAITLARDMGFRVAAIDRNPTAAGASLADVFSPISTDDREGALAFARRVRADGVLTVINETGVPVVSYVAETLGLPSPSQRTARLATHKRDMRRAFEEHGVPTVRSELVRTPAEARAFGAREGFPLVVKPSDASGQSGVALIGQSEPLEPALAEALRHSTDRTAVLERFVPGPEINVCAVAHGGETEVLSMSYRRTLPPPHFGIATRHVYPLAEESGVQGAIRDAARSAIAAIGLTEGVAYPQLILGPDGPVVIEIAIRVPGGYMCELAELASGIDMMRAAILQAAGGPFELEPLRQGTKHAAVIVEFYTALCLPEGSAQLRDLSGIEQASEMDGVVKVDFRIRPGDPVPALTSSRARFGAIVVVGGSPDEAARRLERAKAAIRIQ
jgi:carbamoyl-phosphate synthase large subunit